MNKTKEKITKLIEVTAHHVKPGWFIRKTKRHNWTKVQSVSRLTGYKVDLDGNRVKTTKTVFNDCMVFHGTEELYCKIEK